MGKQPTLHNGDTYTIYLKKTPNSRIAIYLDTHFMAYNFASKSFIDRIELEDVQYVAQYPL